MNTENKRKRGRPRVHKEPRYYDRTIYRLPDDKKQLDEPRDCIICKRNLKVKDFCRGSKRRVKLSNTCSRCIQIKASLVYYVKNRDSINKKRAKGRTYKFDGMTPEEVQEEKRRYTRENVRAWRQKQKIKKEANKNKLKL